MAGLEALATQRMPEYLPASAVDLAGQVIEAVLGKILRPILWQSLILTALAALMLWYARRVDRRASPAASEAETEILRDNSNSPS
jgi:hypothetical protein